MKRTQMVTRVKLDLGRNNDYILLGLVSSEPDYKLSFSLNKKLGISLRNISAINLTAEDLTFSRFSNNNATDDLIYTLISNRSGKAYLLNKLKNIDYLLQIQVSQNDFDNERLTAELREIESVTAVFRIDTGTLKDKNLHYLSE
jgi:hypothetical protein